MTRPMFEFLRKRAERKRMAAERQQSFKKVAADIESGKGNPLEAALVVHLVESSKASFARLLIATWHSEVFTFNKGEERLRDAMLTQGSDGHSYVACFTSEERIGPRHEFPPYNRQDRISLLELIFALGENAGIVLNPQDEHLNWTFTPEDVARLRLVTESSFNFEEGGIYSIWKSGSFGAAKLLRRDDKGVHVRVYANTWQERPTEIETGTLGMETSGEGMPKAFGHMPLATHAFLAMGPKLSARSEVKEDELDGYKLWQENQGGYFGV